MDDRREIGSEVTTNVAGEAPAGTDSASGPAPIPFEDLAPAIVMPGGLLARAEQVLRRAVQADPASSAALRNLATVSRCCGNLREAADASRRLAELQPDDLQARYLHAVLSGQEPPPGAVPRGAWPAPFVRIEGFLAPAEHDALLKTAHEQQDCLEASRIGTGNQYNPQRRSSWVVCRELDTLVPWFLPRVKAALPGVLPRLEMAPFLVGEVELQMTVHRSGGFYKVHRDIGEGDRRSRQVSYVYYFHRMPKPFTGGDLLLYDTDVEEGAYAAVFTRIEALDNSIVFFPSAYWHQVTPVHCATDDFGSSRFTLNGWFHSRTLGETGRDEPPGAAGGR
jgi:Rps23 Pro-64 3,4-dihydroxylase Tpa1-like proline 4-hydroxylase